MDGSGYNHADLGEFQNKLSDMVVTYQQLPEGEQPAAFHLLQASLGPLLAVPADYVLAEAQPGGHHLIIADHQYTAAVQQHAGGEHHTAVRQREELVTEQEQLASEREQQERLTVEQERLAAEQAREQLTPEQEQDRLTPHEQEGAGEDGDYGPGEAEEMEADVDQPAVEETRLAGEQDGPPEGVYPPGEEGRQHASDRVKEVSVVSCGPYPAAPRLPAGAGTAQLPPPPPLSGPGQQHWSRAGQTPAAADQSSAPAPPTAALPPSRRPDSERYVCPSPSCGRPCGHRKALVLHVKWEHLPAPVSCRACRVELATYEHFLYHKRTCFQGVSALVCPDCDARFTMELSYKRHLAGHALNECRACGKRLSSRKALVKHLRHEHSIRECEKWFTCDKCPKKFMKKRSWLAHSKVHATQDDVQCGRCGLTLGKHQLAEHLKTEHGRDPYTCATCHKRFRRNQQYVQHMKLHEQYDCSLCGAPFVTQSAYAAHMQSEHKMQPELLTGSEPQSRNRCEVCGAVFFSQTQLSEHLQKHPSASLKCSRCQTEFESAAHLHRHLRRSLCARQPLQLICHHCGAQFGAHFALRKHLLRAHGEGATSVGRCPHCDYTNIIAANLRRHIAAHQQLARRFVCDQCAAAFHTLSTLKDHQLYVHTTEKRFTCAECQKAFKTSSSLNRHLRVHSETRPYECYCGNAYKRMSHLRRHMTAVHNLRTRTRLIERLDGSAAASSDSGSDAAGSTGRGGGGEGGDGGSGDGGDCGKGDAANSSGDNTGDAGTNPTTTETSDWSGLVSEQGGVTYVTDDGLLRIYSVAEDLPDEFTLPQGVYNTDTVLLPDGSRSILLKPAGELGCQPVGGGGEEAVATLPPPSTIRSSQQRLV